MTSSFDYLLSLSPIEALVRMVNDQNGTNFLLDSFTAGVPTQIGDTTTQVTLTPKPKANPFDFQAIQTPPITLTYDRLDLNVFLRNVLNNYNPTLPLSTQNVLNEITSLIGQEFYIDDILLTEVTRDNGNAYALTAKPESLRFVGSIVLDLITLTPISTLIASTALTGVDDETAVLFSLTASTPYLNATDFRSTAGEFTPGDLAQNKADLVTLFNAVVPDPSTNDDFNEAPWHVNTTPGPFNLYGSSVVGYGSGLNVNPAIPTLETALIVNLDGTHCTNFTSGHVVIPYTAQNFELDGYTAFPRLTANSIVSLSNGTAWNVYLNSFVTGSTITSFQASPPVTMDGSSAWVAANGLPSPTNLYGATVVYNGQLRPTDLAAATQGLDRILVVDMGIENSVWQGNYAFYYASPLPLTWKGFPTLNGTVGSYFQQDFTPDGGTGPFTYTTSGTLPAGLSMNGSLLEGTCTTAGSTTFGLTITDANDTAVAFTITLVVGTQVGQLNITGNLANAVINTPYTGFLNITGGLLPYSGLGIISGSLPPGLSMALDYNTIAFTGTPTVADSYPFSVSISSADGQQVSASFIFVVSETYATLTLTGTYSEGVIGTSYDSSLLIAGGNGVYSDPEVVAGSLPPGLSLVIFTLGAPQLILQGTPSATGTYTFTVQIFSGDGQTVQSAQSVTIVASS